MRRRCHYIRITPKDALVDGAPAKVCCRTCYYEHKYRHGKGGAKKKKAGKKAALFDEVLAKMTGGGTE